jgi:hypothetical protein
VVLGQHPRSSSHPSSLSHGGSQLQAGPQGRQRHGRSRGTGLTLHVAWAGRLLGLVRECVRRSYVALRWEEPETDGAQEVRAVSSLGHRYRIWSFRPTASPKRLSPARTYGEFPTAELTRLRRRTDITLAKGRRRVGARDRLKKGGLLMTRARSPPTQHSSKQAEEAQREPSPPARLDLLAARPL